MYSGNNNGNEIVDIIRAVPYTVNLVQQITRTIESTTSLCVFARSEAINYNTIILFTAYA